MIPRPRKVTLFSEPLFYLYLCYLYWISYLHRVYTGLTNPSALVSPKDETQIYIETQTARFLQMLDSSNMNWNENIHPDCYNGEKFKEMVQEENNELEKTWRRRILFEHTPRGNIMMYYDAFKQAFAYSSDQQIPYPILNACAMKYVRIYRCLDFFLDSSTLPNGRVSPFSIVQEEMERKEKDKLLEKKKEMGISHFHSASNAPFLKPKTARLQKPEKVSPENTGSSSLVVSKKYTNIFRYLGKMCNVSVLVKEIVPKKNPNLNVPIEHFDYFAYKKLLNAKKNEEEVENGEEDDGVVII